MASPVKNAKQKAQQRWPGAIVVERGKGHIKHQHPTDPSRFMLDIQSGAQGWHFGAGPYTDANEIDSAWVDADPILDAPWLKKMVLADYHAYFGPGTQEFDAGQIIRYVHPGTGEQVTFQPQQLQWTNDLNQVSAISNPQKITPSSIVDDTIRWNNAFGPGRHFEWQTQTARLKKLLILDSLAALGAPPQFIIDGGNPVLKLQFIFQKSSNVELVINGVVWDEKANNPQLTGGDIEFRLASTLQTLWHFKRPNVWDLYSPPTDIQDDPFPYQQGQLYVRKQALNVFVEVRVAWSWLQAATYPVYIDPSVDEQVGASTDDSQHYDGNGTNAPTANQAYVWKSSNKWNRYWGGFRFQTVAVPNAATINDGTYFEGYVASGGNDDPNFDLYGEAVDDSVTFAATTNYISGLTRTTASVNYSGTNVGTAAFWGSSVELKTVIQEIVNRAGWATGQDLNLIAVGIASAPDERIDFRTYDNSTSQAAKLHIEYTAGGPSPVSVTLKSGALSASGVKALPSKRLLLDTAALSTAGVKMLPSRLVRIGTAALAMTGVPFKIAQAVRLNTGALALNGVTVRPSRPVVLGTGALSLAGVKALPSRVVLLNSGALSLAGVPIAKVGPVVIIQLSTGALTLAGVSLLPSKRVLLNTGALTLNGVTALPSRVVVLGSGALTINGVPLTVSAISGVSVVLSTGALSLAGVKALPSRRVFLNTGALTLAGVPITITVAGVAITVILGTGALSTAGVKMLPSRLVQLGTGGLTAGGVGLLVPRAVPLGTGALTLGGVKALPSKRVLLDAAALTLSGVPISVPAAITLLMVLHGKDRSFILNAELRDFILNGLDRSFVIDGRKRQ